MNTSINDEDFVHYFNICKKLLLKYKSKLLSINEVQSGGEFVIGTVTILISTFMIIL